MAIVYPSASGNWSDTSLWMEVGGNPYNQIPQIDDVVYLNGCTMTANMNIDLGTNGEIRNDEDARQGISAGGYVTLVANRSYTANFYAFDKSLFAGNVANSTINFIGNFYAENVSNIAISLTNYSNTLNFTGDITAINSTILSVGNGQRNMTFNGDINLTNSSLISGAQLNFNSSNCTTTVNGDITAIQGSFVFNLTSGTSNNGNLTINGDINCDAFFGGDITRYLTITGNITHGSGAFISGSTTQFTMEGNISQGNGNLFGSNITTFNMNGTLTQGQGQIAFYITTLNLDGTLNLSGTRPFTTGVQNLNVATGGSVTYDNHLYYCFTNIVAVDSNFTITCRNQNLDNFDFKNKNLLNNTYPAQANVSDGYVYGLEDQFTGSYQLPPESVVLEGTPYGSHVGTLTLDISSSVQDTIDDIEDEVNVLVDSYPPLVTLESITNIGNTSATINLSVSNTALITKTGAEVDIDWNFSNPYEYEVNNWATSVNVTGLNPSVQYYVRGYVIYDGNKVYSSANTLQTLLLPPQLQLCEYLQTDGNAYIQTDVLGNDINVCECKAYCNVNARFIFRCFGSTTAMRFDLTTQSNGKYNSRIFQNANTTSSVNRGQVVVYKFDRRKKIVQFNDEVINFTHTLNSNTGTLQLFSNSELASGTQMYYWTSNVAKFYSCYVKSGETYEDNKGNICSADTAGMCDILTGTFYTNDGGGNFTHGNDII